MKIVQMVVVALSFSLLFSWQSTFASIEVGGGLNSFTSGRVVPSTEVSLTFADSAVSWMGAGVRNYYYYQVAHQVSYFKTWKAGTLWGGEMNSGFGGSVAYSIRSFIDEGSTSEQKSSDFIIGPAIRMNWSYGLVFLNMTATFGLRDLWQHLSGLTFQDVETLSIGVRF